ncbi:hypothetical protein [Actinoplanes xinjiangensis]|uniref:Uncharacterized protein n=1 Tax=Actinoplanes xinjiangensis TaxID=512350 RepID=A0A316FTA2_9ACTN|nr:hypothetical protein [Actinoplanes xinjiangensis]PWK43542.1 hypothetical protein BC793_113224 [Actinoplanes xinjiangensis]GIF41859.1 hypothetical protein Axi01nite_61700 [Actinoplanes xinjiangensis]
MLLVLALLGYLAVVAINDARHPPEQPVRELFAALTARDTAAAADLAGCASPACTGTALAGGYQPPEHVDIGEPVYGDPADITRRPDKSIAFVPVSYRLSGARQETTIRVQRTGDGLARPYRILYGATGRLTITGVRVAQVQVGAATVPAGEPDGPGLTVLPGTYSVQAAGDVLFAPAEAGPVRVDVPATADSRATPQQVALTVRVRPEAAAQVDEQIRALLTDCTRQTDLRPPGCPFQVPGIVIGADDVRWYDLQPPTVEIVPVDDPGLTGAPATVRTVTPGQVTVTYTAFTSVTRTRDTITQRLPVQVGGTVTTDPADPATVTWTR